MNAQGVVCPNLVGWQVRRDRQKESRPPTQAVPREVSGHARVQADVEGKRIKHHTICVIISCSLIF